MRAILIVLWLTGCPGGALPSKDRDTPPSDSGRRDSHTAESEPVDTGDCASPTPWYTDADGDTYGDPGTVVLSCTAPDGTISDGTDCDDSNPEVYPGASEVCGDGVINDCNDTDGTGAEAACTASNAYDLSGADARFIGEEAFRHAGWAVAGGGDANGDGYDDVLLGTSGTTYEFSGPVLGTMPLSDADMIFDGDGGGAGLAIANAGDQDGDGLPDLLVGARAAGEDGYGEVYLLVGPEFGERDLSDVVATFVATIAERGSGYSVAGLGDVDGDGWDDLAVGTPAAQGYALESDAGACADDDIEEEGREDGVAAGASYVFLGPVSADHAMSEADIISYGEDGQDAAGYPTARPGDLDGDGLADQLMGAGGNCEGGLDAGAAYVVLSPVAGDLYLGDADLKLVGERANDEAGNTVAGAGDVNGDGAPDLLVGAPEKDDYKGAVYLVLWPESGRVDLSSAPARLDGETSDAQAGSSVASAGDVNRDGFDDLLIGSLWDSTVADLAGAAYLIYGPISGSARLGDDAVGFFSTTSEDNTGYSVAGAGDVDADGVPDLLVGTLSDDEGGENAGAVSLILGGSGTFPGTYSP